MSISCDVCLSVYLLVRLSTCWLSLLYFCLSLCLTVQLCDYVCWTDCPFFFLSVCLPICLSADLSVWASACLFICLSMLDCWSLFVFISFCLSVCWSFWLGANLSLCSSVCLLVNLSISVSMHNCSPLSLFVCLTVCPSVCLSISTCMLALPIWRSAWQQFHVCLSTTCWPVIHVLGINISYWFIFLFMLC